VPDPVAQDGALGRFHAGPRAAQARLDEAQRSARRVDPPVLFPADLLDRVDPVEREPIDRKRGDDRRRDREAQADRHGRLAGRITGLARGSSPRARG